MTLRWKAVLLPLFISVAGLYAGEPLYLPFGADAMGMAFAVTAHPGHWNCFHNQALLKTMPSTSFSLALENRYSMPALSTKGASAVIAAGTAPLGMVISHYGNADYHRLFLGAGSAVRLADGLCLGLQADYLSEHGVGEYRDRSSLTFEAGMTCRLSPSLTLGWHLFNPLAPLNTLPSSVETGLQWQESDNLVLTLSGSKVSDEPLSVQCGVEWRLHHRLVLRTGYMSSPSSFAFGIGFLAGRVKADTGFLMNGQTGLTTAVSIIWTLR